MWLSYGLDWRCSFSGVQATQERKIQRLEIRQRLVHHNAFMRILSLWYARKYVIGTRSPRENRMNHGTRKVPKDVQLVPST
ncbi:MAG: hypothetical protein ACR2LL_04950 [Nitrosopumilus sp.]|uniref:hypothetical protein n=1 Tax=Nitrosopumilus sp. TaxID=2024843 RepID=UPI0029300572|nr:hypothetical protein [Nitrosopumilus sp.]